MYVYNELFYDFCVSGVLMIKSNKMVEDIKIKHNQFLAWGVFLFSLAVTIWSILALYKIYCLQNYPHEVPAFGIDYIILPKGESEIKVLVVAFFMCIGFLFPSGRIIFGKTKYAVVACHQGLWLDRYGLLPWDSIEDIYVRINYSKYGNPSSCLAIQLKNIDFVRERVSWFARFYLFILSFVAPNNIFLSPLELDVSIAANRLHDFMITCKKEKGK